MNFRFAALTLVVAFGSSSFAKVDCSAEGSSTLMSCQLQAKGFRCSSEKSGDICVVSSVNSGGFKYSRSIAILVPKDLKQPENILLHIHGFKGVCESAGAGPEEMQKEFSLLDQMKNAGASKSVMIFPMSVGKCATFQAELVPRFGAFTRWAEQIVKPSTDRWVLSGHSGAGSVLSLSLVSNLSFVQKVDSVFLEDATYGMSTHVLYWNRIVKANPKIVIASITRPQTPTAGGAQILLSSLKPKGIKTSFASTPIRHCQIPNKRSDGQASFYEKFLSGRLQALAK